ncbi:MAG: hypothetical protein M1826_005723 [Phylliscum demangeonii]|nr:MAG: hypothetical protein M1826_005723 [Phylliscum demangeonii]
MLTPQIHAANKHNKYFLAVSGGHGAIDSLRHMQNGVEIWMRRLNYVHINSDGKTATMGGGLLSKEITDALWAHKKQTDNIVSARLVLANGTAVTVSSQTNPDLYWALKGAGHNFGVVSELTYNIYDVPAGNIWTYESFTFSADKVEQVFDPVIKFFVLYEGTPDREARFGAPYHKIGPLNVVTGTATYPELSALTGNGNNDIACQHNYAALRFPISLRSYNLVAQRSIFDQFAQITAVQPLFNNSVFLFEGYSLRAVKAVPSDSTAFPDRQDNLLVSPVFIYPTNSSLDAQAIAAGQEIRQTLLHGSGSSDLNAYVNYAHGDETLQELYGHDSWRVPKLQELKKHYDPHGRFNFYAPITTS